MIFFFKARRTKQFDYQKLWPKCWMISKYTTDWETSGSSALLQKNGHTSSYNSFAYHRWSFQSMTLLQCSHSFCERFASFEHILASRFELAKQWLHTGNSDNNVHSYVLPSFLPIYSLCTCFSSHRPLFYPSCVRRWLFCMWYYICMYCVHLTSTQKSWGEQPSTDRYSFARTLSWTLIFVTYVFAKNRFSIFPHLWAEFIVVFLLAWKWWRIRNHSVLVYSTRFNTTAKPHV